MILTSHAIVRIQERTKLTPEAVIDLFASGAYSTFYQGTPEDLESLHVFYSYPDNKFFIAVTDVAMAYLITVLKKGHNIKVRRFKSHHLTEARKKWHQYRFAKMAITVADAPATTQEDVSTPRLLGEGFLEVHVEDKVVFTHELGDVYKDGASSERQFMSSYLEIISIIYQHVSKWLEERPAKAVRYELWIRRPGVNSTSRRFRIKHSKLRAHLNQVSIQDQS